MKRAAIILVMMFFPFSAWALKPVADSDLSTVSGRDSLNIRSEVPAESVDNARAVESADKEGAVRKFSFISLLLGNNESVLSPLMKKSDSEKGASENIQDINKVEGLSNTRKYSIEYPDGQRDGSNKPVVTDLRPDGRTQLRVYYTNDTNSYVFPKSWVDIRPR